MMNQVLRFLRIFALGAWIGAIIYFAAVVTRGAFAVLPNRDEAGLLVGRTLTGLHQMGLAAAIIFVLASLVMRKGSVDLAVTGVMLMWVLTIASQVYVMPRMNVLRKQMVSVEATSGNDARHAEFDRLHGISVDLEVGVLLVGLASLFLAAREKAPPSA